MKAEDTAIFLLFVLGVHWFADFVCQTHWQASNKSSNWLALGRHVFSYTAVLSFGVGYLLVKLVPGTTAIELAFFAIWTFVTHGITDAITSRITSSLWKQQRWHDFFVVVGADQVIHYITIWSAFALLGTFK